MVAQRRPQGKPRPDAPDGTGRALLRLSVGNQPGAAPRAGATGTREGDPMSRSQHDLAVFIDFENLALGFPKSRSFSFEIARVLDRLLEKGKVIVKTAYADWSRFRPYTKSLHEAGVELIEIPKRSLTGKNSADIHMCVDAMDLCYSKPHIDSFVIVSGDSDFSPLVSKLKENGKQVIGLAMKGSTAQLLADNCDEFIYYDDLIESSAKSSASVPKGLPAGKRKAFSLLVETVRALQRENYDVLHSSMVKDTMKRKQSSFDEGSAGYRSFSELLEDAEEAGLIKLHEDERSGTYTVSQVKTRRKRRSRSEK
jgi:uncharacterized protein (TIGR00288 family)